MWAEVIGDPVAHSLSPAIHGCWLRELGLHGRYAATAVKRGELEGFLASRRGDPAWRGCNVTAPHKESVAPLLDRLDADAAAVGAVNCIYRADGGLAGANTDIDGIGEALSDVELSGRSAVVIGGGGAARAALHWLRTGGAGDLVLAVRRPQAALDLGQSRVVGLEDSGDAIRAAGLVVNATPLGRMGGEPMPRAVLDALARTETAVAFDMVYHPLQTSFLEAARASGLRAFDGLSMLIGQARRSFFLFFGVDPPTGDDLSLRILLERTMEPSLPPHHDRSRLTGAIGRD